MGREILITGGAGYIGSHTVLAIMEQTDWTPVSIDNLSNSEIDVYDRIADISGVQVKHYEVDITDEKALGRVFSEHSFEGIMHFAAWKAVGESVERPLEYYQNNLSGQMNILRFQLESGIRHHIHSSSCTVYGSTDSLPVTESSQAGQAESPYGWTKVMGEQILEDLCRANDDIRITALRYFNPIGAHQSGRIGELPKGVPNNLVPYITQTAAGIRESLTIHGNDYPTRDGTCVRDYIHVSDIAEAHVAAMQRLLDGKQDEALDIINLGTGQGVTVKEVVDAFIEVNGVELPHHFGPRRAGDIMEIFADRKKAESLLGWTPKRSLEECMASAWKWQQELSTP